MKYLGITQKTIEWLLSHSEYPQAIKNKLIEIINDKSVSTGVITAGPLRVAAYEEQLLLLWNNDYLSGTDYEDWGFIKIYEPYGLLSNEAIFNDVLIRELQVINLRLQGLLLPDDRMIHRSVANNIHTCLAGNGDIARHYSIGWYEDTIVTKQGSFHSIICAGPSNEEKNQSLISTLESTKETLPRLLKIANQIITTINIRPVLDVAISKYFNQIFNKKSFCGQSSLTPVQDSPELDVELAEKRYDTLTWNYETWISNTSTLSKVQRHILESDLILTQPIRIVGAAGTGKTLLMQLLVMRRLKSAEEKHEPLTILYLVHNSEIENTLWNRFETLGATNYLVGGMPQKLVISTLFNYACRQIGIEDPYIIDKDAMQTKLYQKAIVKDGVCKTLAEYSGRHNIKKKSAILDKIQGDNNLLDILSNLICNEISIGIKGHGLSGNKQKYVHAERPLTRFHGVLSEFERQFVYDVFEKYHKIIFEENAILDSDDIALTLLANLRSPLWDIKRKTKGFDFIFVDETQLFNQNERQIFKFLSKRVDYVPIVLALDEAQELRGTAVAGFGALGISDLQDETLPEVYRCTPSILKLAFYTISRSVDLFGANFPNFTKNTTTLVNEKHPSARFPQFVCAQKNLPDAIMDEIIHLRKMNIRKIGIVVHSDRYWANIVAKFSNQKSLPVFILQKRGEDLASSQGPIICISKPEYIGGQEFDAILCIGLEYGVIPPIVEDHAGLQEALEQQALREMYLAFTRAKYQLIILNSPGTSPSRIVQQAIDNHLIEKRD